MKQITLKEVFEMFDPSVHEAIQRTLDMPGTDGVIVFENQNMSSQNFGDRTSMVFGPGRTYKSPKDAEGKHLWDLPSRRQTPVAFAYKEENANGSA